MGAEAFGFLRAMRRLLSLCLALLGCGDTRPCNLYACALVPGIYLPGEFETYSRDPRAVRCCPYDAAAGHQGA